MSSAHPHALVLAAALACGSMCSFSAHAFQEDPAPAAVADAGAPQTMKATVAAVKGIVQVRSGDADPWKKVEVGMVVDQGAEFRTGPRSSVTCTIPPDQTIVLDRLGTVKILEAMQSGTTIKTDLAMKYGRTDYAIEAAGKEHESTIRTPSSTLAVRGTSVSMFDQPPFAPEARTFTGHASYQFAKRQMTVGKGSASRGGQNSADTALLTSVVDPTSANTRTNSEANLIAVQSNRGAVVTTPQSNNEITTIRGGPGPQSDAELMRSLPGVLTFAIRWTGDADVDLVATVSPGDQLKTLGQQFNPQTVLFPGLGLQTSASGGRIPYDHRGGPNGGEELCFWPGAFPTAVYGVGALNNSTTTAVDVKFNAYLNGEKISMYAFDEQGSLVRSTGFRRIVPADSTEATIVLAPPLAALEDPRLVPTVPDETIDGTASTGASPIASSRGARVQARRDAKAAAKDLRASQKLNPTPKPAAVRSR